jgi:tripeptidyl-peptidase I
MKVQLSTLTLGLAIAAAAVPAPHTHVVHEKRSSEPSKWVNVGRVDPADNVVVRIGLKQSNLHRGYEYLMDM